MARHFKLMGARAGGRVVNTILNAIVARLGYAMGGSLRTAK